MDTTHVMQQETLDLYFWIVKYEWKALRCQAVSLMLSPSLEVIGICKQLTISLFMLVVLENALVYVQQKVNKPLPPILRV